MIFVWYRRSQSEVACVISNAQEWFSDAVYDREIGKSVRNLTNTLNNFKDHCEELLAVRIDRCQINLIYVMKMCHVKRRTSSVRNHHPNSMCYIT